MNTARIRKLQKKFTLVASLSFILVMLMMGGIMYATSLLTTRGEIKRAMDYIIENDGDANRDIWNGRHTAVTSASSINPIDTGTGDGEIEVETGDDEAESAENVDADDESTGNDILDALHRIFKIRSWMYDSAEFRYSLRYFAVLYDEDMNVEEVKTSHIAAVEPEEAKRYATIALDQFLNFGSYGDYYYQVADRVNGGRIVVYLESTRQISSVNRLLYTALGLIGLGSIAAICMMRAFSRWIMKKEIENNEMQNRFVTNASHELKTPLAVIKANTEVEQMLNGENEWNQSTLRQVERMTGLIQNLIRIVRAEEKEEDIPISKLDIIPIIQETVDTYQPVASQAGKKLECELESSAVCWMRETDLRQLVSLLLDNAIKYCDEEGTIQVSLGTKGRNLQLSVSNSYAEGENVDFRRFFERFYREDESHNTDNDDNKGGYGIGLSIAENLMEKYKGTIDVSWEEGRISFVCMFHKNKKIK